MQTVDTRRLKEMLATLKTLDSDATETSDPTPPAEDILAMIRNRQRTPDRFMEGYDLGYETAQQQAQQAIELIVKLYRRSDDNT